MNNPEILNSHESLCLLPSVDELLRCDEILELQRTSSREQLVSWIREAVHHVRDELIAGRSASSEIIHREILDRVSELSQADKQKTIQHVINATGILLHTNLGRAPLAELAVERMRHAAAYTNLELDLSSGRRSRRGERLHALLAKLCGTDDALVVNNCAAATVLVLQSLARGREVIVSRGQLVEIGGGFRLPDVFSQSAGVILKDIGTTNRTYLKDYEQSINETTGALLRVHRSNFQQIGFVAEPTIQELAGIPRPAALPLIDDLGSGCMYDLSRFGLNEPTVPESVKAGTDLTMFSGDKLFGGPQCGMIVGRQRWIDQLRTNPLMRALRCDKVTLAALEATVEIHLAGDAFERLPILNMLAKTPKQVHDACASLRERLGRSLDRIVSVQAVQSQIGGGALPGATLPSYGLCFQCQNVQQLAQHLRLGSPPVQGRLSADRLVLDLRTVFPDEIDSLSGRLQQLSPLIIEGQN